MKTVLPPLMLCACLWLAGCATQGAKTPTPPESNSSNAVASSHNEAASPSPLVYPAGGLKPLSSNPLDSSQVQALTPPADLWERIRRGFAMPDLDTDVVRERELWYSSRPDYIARMTERSNKYLFYIVEELERRDMPSELALLPFIESAFNPQAVSSAKAAGMWQFMPATGRQYDLKQNLFRDDRRDVIESTRAALDYLQKLHDMFGDWQLALAAYNWGEGSVQRAITKAQKSGLGSSYIELTMPMETRMYVPKLQAVKNIVANPQAFRITLPTISNHPYFQSVVIKRDIDVALAASLAEVPLVDFKELNPSVNKPVLLASGTSQILLPWDNAERFQGNLEAYTGGRLASWTAWISPATLKVADAAKRVGMTESELRAVNNIPARMLIRAGSTLLVRRSAGVVSDVSLHVADTGQLSLSPEVTLRKTTVRAARGDTVASLSKRYAVSPSVLAGWNKVSASASFHSGQVVILYLPTTASTGNQHKGVGKARVQRKAASKPLHSTKK